MSRYTDDYIDNLRHEMSRAGMRLGELAEACGLSRQSISLYLSGKVAPTIDSVCQIAEGLGVPPAVLMMTPEERQRYDVGCDVVRTAVGSDIVHLTALKEEAPRVYDALLALVRYGLHRPDEIDVPIEEIVGPGATLEQ